VLFRSRSEDPAGQAKLFLGVMIDGLTKIA
jgi:hypothetical protein